ncbi:hypothetical protein T459_22988 [Capsicum annuum]|uniref:Helicase C-terminal domain-containing protein n=1 Tax=Capsicum annuum TaxID=4072 RepID=A0A2G2YR33_CAPAN|nr:hypothetical protein FXO37_22086 [Capsicum annuum]PHT72203.1 hypothetical protein T459_22988 [Capsicum annuum]
MTDYEIRHQKAKKEFHPLRDDEDVGLPFLIITTSAALPLWEAEFSCWTGVNVVVYQDSQLSPVTYVSKMYQDKCATRFNSCSVLSLLDTKYDKANNELNTDSDLDLTEFKKRLKHFVAYECKSSSSKFIEYWSHDGSGVYSIRNILSDLIPKKFGGDSCMNISGSGQGKIATLNKYNNMESGIFSLLMETSASVRSVIKLSGIEIILSFNSDWNPNNDLRSLQKILFNSKSEHINVLHLYSCFTVEEKALMLAMRGKHVRIKGINQVACQELLSWRAPYLFNVQSSISK